MKTFVKSYIELVGPATDAPDVFHEAMGYFLLSSAVNRQVWMRMGTFTVYPNLWVILFGGTTQFRKSSSIDFPLQLLREVNENLELPSHFSIEGLADYMVNQPAGFIRYDEFMKLMQSFKRDYLSGLQAWLTEIFACPDRYVFKRRPKQNKDGSMTPNNTEIKSIFLNIIAATTMDWFSKSVTESDVHGGFLPRFLMIPAGEPKPFKAKPMPVSDEGAQRMVDWLQKIAEVKGEMRVKMSADALYEQVACEIHAEIVKRDDPLFARIDSYFPKFCMLENLNTGAGLEIDEDSIRRARALVMSAVLWMDRIRAGMALNWEHRQLLRVLEMIPTGEETVSANEILRRTGMLRRTLDPIIDTLADRGDIEVLEKRQEPGKAGRPSRQLRRCPPEMNAQ